MAAAQVVAVEPFAVEVNGQDVMVHDGDVFDAKHPVVKGREHLFKPRDTHGVAKATTAKRKRWAKS
jgi:hypothetical protein